jgi:hypothetical protein
MSASVASLPRTETRLLEIDPSDGVAGVLWGVVEMVHKCEFAKIFIDNRTDTPIRVADRETGVSGIVPGSQLGDFSLTHRAVGMLEEESDDEEWSISSISSYDSDSANVGDLDASVCNRCHHGEAVIESRGFGWEDWLEIRDMGSGGELICRSCVVGRDDFYCIDCGYSEVLCKQYHGEQLGQFYLEGQTRPEYQDETTRCQGCRARVERYEREEREERAERARAWLDAAEAEEARAVNRVLFPENNGEEDPNYSLVVDEWAETYEGELEPGEEEEDNTEEKALRVKKTVQEMGELLFDIKDKITEGEYLKLMDGLQSITNEMNQ